LKNDPSRKNHKQHHKRSLEQSLAHRKLRQSKHTQQERRQVSKRRFRNSETGPIHVRPTPRTHVDRSDISALYDFDESLLDGMGVNDKNDRKFLGEVARCVFRMKNDQHDYVEARISGIDPTEKMLVFSLIYKGSVPLDFSEQQSIKDACGPRFQNIRCVTIPFESEAERKQFQMSCITQIVVDMMKKKYDTKAYHH
jgi:hypothetical protein